MEYMGTQRDRGDEKLNKSSSPHSLYQTIGTTLTLLAFYALVFMVAFFHRVNLSGYTEVICIKPSGLGLSILHIFAVFWSATYY